VVPAYRARAATSPVPAARTRTRATEVAREPAAS
jgi:hypothetical protein